jgi:hypothetical protein
MTAQASLSPRPPLREPPRPLQWRSWPIRDELPWPWRANPLWPPSIKGIAAAVPYAMLAVTAAMIGYSTRNLAFTASAVAIVLLCLWRWYIPVRFEVNSQGITTTILGQRRRIPWSAIGHYEIQRHGVFLLPNRRLLLERLRGMYIPFDPEERLPELVKYYLDPWIEPAE